LSNSFVCCTPFHVIVTLQMVSTLYKNEQNDVFISDHFSSALKIYLNLKEIKNNLNIREVYFVRDKDISYDTSRFKQRKIKGLLFGEVDQYISDYLDVTYTNLFVFTHSLFSNILVNYAYKKNRNVKINFVEEGRMTYLFNSKEYKNKLRNYLDKLFKIFNKRLLNIELANSLFLFQPGLYSGDYNKRILKIPNLIETPEIKDILNNVFEYKPQPDFSKVQYIFFDQSFSIDQNKNINEYSIIKTLDLELNENILIKLHPRDSLDKYSEYEGLVVNNCNFPWELIYLNENLKGKVFITLNSSAVFTPKILFGENHKIVLLKNYFNYNDKELDGFINKYEDLCTEKTVFQPDSLIEFRGIITSDYY
jgi:hypothetical protein